jgi:hypothetical protein
MKTHNKNIRALASAANVARCAVTESAPPNQPRTIVVTPSSSLRSLLFSINDATLNRTKSHRYNNNNNNNDLLSLPMIQLFFLIADLRESHRDERNGAREALVDGARRRLALSSGRCRRLLTYSIIHISFSIYI